MAYSVQADLERAAGGSERLKALTDIEGSGQLNTAVMDEAIAEADSWINTYARRRYSVPFDPVPDSIKRLSAAEAVYRLKAKRSAVDELDQAQHEERIQWLEGLVKGLVDPGVEPPPTRSSAVGPKTIERTSDDSGSRADWDRSF